MVKLSCCGGKFDIVAVIMVPHFIALLPSKLEKLQVKTCPTTILGAFNKSKTKAAPNK